MRKSNRCAVWLMSLALVVPTGLFGQEEEPYELGTALPPLLPGRALAEISVDEAVARALEMNLDIQTARLNPEIQRRALEAAEATFSPTLNSTYGYNNSTNQSISQLDGGNRISTVRQTFNASINKAMPWYGGQLSANFNNSRTETDNAFTTLNPSFRSILSFNYTQPLLAGFSTDDQRTALETQAISATASSG